MRRSTFLLSLLVVGLLGLGSSLAQAEFRAEFDNETIESAISNFEYWDEISNNKEIDDAIDAHLTMGHDAPEYEVRANDTTLRIIERDDLIGKVVWAHEGWEMHVFLGMGYSQEQIANGSAWSESGANAHALARYKELQLYQFLYSQLIGGTPPAMRAFLFVHPTLIYVWENDLEIGVDRVVMRYLLYKDLGEYSNIVRDEDSSSDDIEKVIRFFEAVGYDFGDQREVFLNRGLDFLVHFR